MYTSDPDYAPPQAWPRRRRRSATLSDAEVAAAVEYNRKRGFTSAVIKQIQRLVGAAADGDFGPKTVRAVAGWQSRHGLEVDGKVGPTTWAAMRAAWVPDLELRPRHPLPEKTRKWGYDHLPFVWHKPDPQWRRLTSDGSFLAGLLRLVTGYRPSGSGHVISRGPDSWISLDEISIGIAHWWSEKVAEIFTELAQREPTLAGWAWGEDVAGLMADPAWMQARIAVRRGKRLHKASYDWLLAGWYEIARHPRIIEDFVARWVDGYTPDAIALLREKGWRRARTAAALVRLANSRGTGGMRLLVGRAERLVPGAGEDAVIETVYFRNDLYDHPERLEQIDEMPEFRGDAPDQVTGTGFDASGPVVRSDGTKPRFVAERL